MNHSRIAVTATVFSLLLPAIFAMAPQTAFGITLLHEFAGGADDGQYPNGSLTISGLTLYGMATRGGDDDDDGVVFKVNTNGTGHTLLHEFAGGAGDGETPYDSLILSGSTLYGTTVRGGDDNYGVVFKMNTDGTGHTLLHEFAGHDGEYLYGSLTLSGSTLYGTAWVGGDNDKGVVFKMNTDGGGFGLLHEFAGVAAGDGEKPFGSLIISGSTLYGTTTLGGDNNRGVVFKVNTDGSGYNHLHEFAGVAAGDGDNPHDSLILSGSTLYGMTRDGGDYDFGTVFKVNTDGTGYGLLHEFAGGADDGRESYGSLILSSTTLYGMTYYGGDDDEGVVFKIDTDGSGFGLLHEFSGGADDGRRPQGSLILDKGVSDITLYGMTRHGGDSDYGVVFSLTIPEPSTLLLLASALLGFAGMLRRRLK